MRNFRLSAGVLGLLVIASIVVVAGCNSPSAVQSSDQAIPLFTQENACPSMDQICRSIANELNSLCPQIEPYKNWGEENSCAKTMIAQLLDSYKDCLSGDELSEVRDCVWETRPRSIQGRAGKDPAPYEL